MNDNQHLSSQYNEELAQLRTQVLQMGGLVETQVSAAMDAYISSQSSQLADIVAADQKINSLEKNIDDNCAHIIAKRQPTASDLRLVLGIIKIVTDLERMAMKQKKLPKVRVASTMQDKFPYNTA
jgi:phosphate transport system protein